MENISPSKIQRNKNIQRCISNLTGFNCNWKNAAENRNSNNQKQFEEKDVG